MPTAPIIANFLNNWINTSSQASTGAAAALRVLIEVRM